MKNDLLYQLALIRVPHIGPIHAKLLLEHFGTASAIFKARTSQLEKIPGMGTVRAAAIRGFSAFAEAEEEIDFIEKYKIRPLCFADADYPQRLLQCCDAPSLLFYRGNADLNAPRIVAIIGTRNHSAYGQQVTEALIRELAGQDVVIVSGLAYGIDALAHRAALKYGLPTVGVLAHGLDIIYPSQHGQLARDMIKAGGGLLTEFTSRTNPDKHNFPARNRIVAGMSDATIVIETGMKGGSMITAELANGYHRDVFAYPGRATDDKSDGCNYLIRSNKAMLLTNAQQLLEVMGWESCRPAAVQQPPLFAALTAEEQKLADLFPQNDALHIDELNIRSGLSSPTIAAAILSMELQGVIQSLPGKRYRLLSSSVL